MSEEQSRAYPRIRKLNLVQVSRFDEEGFRADLATGRTLDLSRGGMRLELHHALPLRSVVSVTLALDDDLVDVRGRVVYLEELDAERCAMGIEFTELGDQAAALLARYVDKAGGESGD
ncbi:MAG TPA: PilZ domain-containing protein [Thermoanaerobaculia bacterium]|jgi:c-di-GMP-binding flagellar brake protein YcgR